MTTIELLQKTKAAWPALSAAPAEEKNRLLLAMADALEESTPPPFWPPTRRTWRTRRGTFPP